MIVTIRTGPHSQAQGELVCHEVWDDDRRQGVTELKPWDIPTGRVTIRVGDKEITGELIERKDR